MVRFNPRPRAAGDRHGIAVDVLAQIVSIHARARRATTTSSGTYTQPPFQSTPARGGRPTSLSCMDFRRAFQSTPARGGRLKGAHAVDQFLAFQSTPARGGRRYH